MKRLRGFTLLEMVVAIGIFAIIAAISYGSLNRFLAAREVIEERNERLRELQLSLMLMELDFRYLMNRPVRDGFGDVEATIVATADDTLSGGELVRFTTSRPDPQLAPVQALQRVAWRLDGGVLARVSWKVIDRDQDSTEYVRELLHDVSETHFSFLTMDDESILERTTEWYNGDQLPLGVEVLVTMKDGRQYRRVFEVANGS